MNLTLTERHKQILSSVLFDWDGKSGEGEQVDKEALELYKMIVNQKDK
jgi:hypothetical protein